MGWSRSNVFFFFQAEDGIRDVAVTGVQTCALPVSMLEFSQKLSLYYQLKPEVSGQAKFSTEVIRKTLFLQPDIQHLKFRIYMSQVELIMPKMGESAAEATIIKWLKNEGDRIALDEPVLEIATDKVDSEIPSPFEGFLEKKLFNEGDVVQVGKAVALISTEAGGAATNTSAPAEEKKKEEPVKTTAAPAQNTPAPVQKHAAVNESSRFYSPLVRNIAKEEGISDEELDAIEGTGSQGSVTNNDILNYLPNKGKQKTKT